MTRLRQIRAVFSATRQVDPKLVPLMIGVPLAVLLVVGGAFSWLLGMPFGIPIGVASALLAASALFGRRATKAQFTAMRGTPGAAAAVLQQMRGRWIVTPAVAYTRQQDLVHRVVGRPGIVLVGEGRKARTTQLLKQEQRRVGRVVGDTPVHVVAVGEDEGQVDLGKLRTHLMKLPKGLGRKEIPGVNKRLRSLGHGDLPVPKGPMPSGVKMPRPKRR